MAVADRPGRPADQQLQHAPRRWPRATSSRRRSATRSIVREPIGVVGCITPWNYPLHQIAAKVAYAMAAGCTVVLKPSEVAPLDAFILAEIIDEVGLPAGVFNLVVRHRPGGRRGDRRPPRRRHGVVHRLDPRRQARRPARRRDGQADRPRARRQVGQRAARRPRRRRLRQGRRRRRRQGVPQLRPDLLGAHPHAGARATAWRRPSRSPPRPSSKVKVGRPVRPRACTSARWPRPPSATACRATSRRASTRAPRSSPAASARPRARHRLLRAPDGVLRTSART